MTQIYEGEISPRRPGDMENSNWEGIGPRLLSLNRITAKKRELLLRRSCWRCRMEVDGLTGRRNGRGRLEERLADLKVRRWFTGGGSWASSFDVLWPMVTRFHVMSAMRTLASASPASLLYASFYLLPPPHALAWMDTPGGCGVLP